MYRELDEILSADDAKAYLDRIGLRQPAEADREALDRIVFAHRCSVPFENLDTVEYGLAPCLETRQIFDKVVRRRRGGWCFELNSLLASLLKALRYTVTAHFARVYHGDEFMTQPLHRVNLVHLGAEKLYCDVGFGGTSPLGSLIVADEIRQSVQGKLFFFRPYSERWLSLYEEEAGVARPLLTFDREACLPVDFTVANGFGAGSEIRFRDTAIVSLWFPDGKLSLDGDKLTRVPGEATETRTILTKRELYKVLAEEFGIELELQKKQILRRNDL